MHRYSYYKTAACTLNVSIGDPQANKEEILKCIQELDSDTQLVVFPELCITGYTCQDLFYEHTLLNSAKQVLFEIVEELPENLVTVIGLPLEIENKLYNCAAICFNHDILGIQVKTYIPSYNEFYETRWFSSASELKENTTFTYKNKKVPVSNHIVFKDTTTSACLGIEICEDLWVTIPVSSTHALAGANVLCNLSASNEIISKANYRRNLVKDQSAKCYAGYVYASAGPTESSSDLVFSGHNLICENGAILSETNTDKIIYGQIDLDHLNHDRLHYKTSMQDLFHGYFACNLRRVLLTLSKLGRPRYLCCVIISASGIAPASFRQALQSARYSTISSFLASSFFSRTALTFFSMVLRFLIVTSIKERAASFSRPNHLLILSVTDIQPYRRTHNEHDKHDCDNGFSVHQLVLLFLLSVLIADKSENARTDNRQSRKAYP